MELSGNLAKDIYVQGYSTHLRIMLRTPGPYAGGGGVEWFVNGFVLKSRPLCELGVVRHCL